MSGVVYKDDSQVVVISAQKLYVDYDDGNKNIGSNKMIIELMEFRIPSYLFVLMHSELQIYIY